MRRIHKDRIDGGLQREQEKGVPLAAPEAEQRWRRYRRHGRKEMTRSLLLEEQWGLCAYTEVALYDFRYGCHIEHIEPKSLNPARTFDYQNVVVSALDSDSLSQFAKADRFGGHFKGNDYDPDMFISPLMPDCHRYFEYLSSGRVEPAQNLSVEDRSRANYTINLLNLNAPFLVNSRRRWLIEIEDEIERLLEDDSALRQLAECELCDTGGRLRGFHSAAKARFGKLGDQVMLNACGNCR
ncbi:retron system putative HNH endonuclease [uncultured Desulfobacter sp.]|uniref:retron system putative HNH endonuclease n=1 Tax=uncultured Desulfobacter sp. TaxID=240139 RepID=UPI0029F4AE1E|nr:retron system putative HNH endonuclease [uncultured Desulfobacter sp.]